MKDTLKNFTGKGLYPPKLAWLLLLPLRNLYLSPKKLCQRLHLQPGWQVLEAGCGPGYFSPYIARNLTRGHLHLADVQKEMVSKAQERLRKYKISNATVHLTDGESLNFPDAKFDCIFLITVLGEIQRPEFFLPEIGRVAKPQSILSITEQAGDPDAINLNDVQKMIEPHGFLLETVYGKGKTFTANFRKTLRSQNDLSAPNRNI